MLFGLSMSCCLCNLYWPFSFPDTEYRQASGSKLPVPAQCKSGPCARFTWVLNVGTTNLSQLPHAIDGMQYAAFSIMLPGHMNRLKRSANTVLSSKSVEPFCVQRSALEASSYDCLYEEANNLLKNLHFQRMMRHGPESPEPLGERGTVSIS